MKALKALLARTELHKTSRTVFKIEAIGLRTAGATVLPLIIGQILKQPIAGLMIGLGGLNVASADKPGATPRTMLIASLCAALAFGTGTVVGNYTYPAIGLMFLCALFGGMLGVFGLVSSQIGFVTTLVFATALGIPGSLTVGAERFVEFGVGGLWTTLLTILLWRYNVDKTEVKEDEEKESPRAQRRSIHRLLNRSPIAIWQLKLKWWRHKLRRHLSFRSVVFQHALRLGIISALTVALYKYLPFQHGLWLTITVLVIIKPDIKDTHKRAAERVIGTLLGGGLAFVLAASIHNTIIIDIMLVCLSAVAYTHVQEDYGLYVFFLTPFILLMLNLAEPGGSPLTMVRITDTLIGGGIALSAAYLLRPRSHWQKSKWSFQNRQKVSNKGLKHKTHQAGNELLD